MAKAAKAAKAVSQSQSKTGYKVKKVLTLPVFSLKDAGTILAIKILSAMYEGKPITGEEDSKDKPATLCSVVNLETGEEGQIVVPAMIKSKLEEYGDGDDGYIGRGFEVENLGKKKGKTRTYNDYRMVELDLEG